MDKERFPWDTTTGWMVSWVHPNVKELESPLPHFSIDSMVPKNGNPNLFVITNLRNRPKPFQCPLLPCIP
jgi:hypothetical protein